MIHLRDDKILHLDKFYMFCYSFLPNFLDYILQKKNIGLQGQYRSCHGNHHPLPCLIQKNKTLIFYLFFKLKQFITWLKIFFSLYVCKCNTDSDSSTAKYSDTAKHSAQGLIVTGPQRWPLWRVVTCNRRGGTLENLNCFMVISAKHRLKFVDLTGNDSDISS